MRIIVGQGVGLRRSSASLTVIGTGVVWLWDGTGCTAPSDWLNHFIFRVPVNIRRGLRLLRLLRLDLSVQRL